MTNYISVGIDIGSQTTRVAIAKIGKKKSGFKIIGRGEAPTEGVKQGYVVNQNEVVKSIQRAVKRAEKEASLRVKSAIISIGGVGLESITSIGKVIISRVDGEITKNDIEKVIEASEKNIQLTNKKIIYHFPLSFKIDGEKVLGHPEGMRGMKLEVEILFIVCFDQHLENLVDAIEKADIDVDDIVAAPLATSLVTLDKKQRTAGCVLVNIGAETVSIGVFENDYLVSLRVFPIGSIHITNDIALGLQISLEEAEEIKTGIVSSKNYPQKKLEEIIEARLRDIFDLINTHLKSLGKNQLLPAGIIITGGGSSIKMIEEIAKSSLKLPARVVFSRSSIDVSDDLDSVVFGVVYGLCLLGMDSRYQSDFFQMGTTKMKNKMKGILGWGKQFLP